VEGVSTLCELISRLTIEHVLSLTWLKSSLKREKNKVDNTKSRNTKLTKDPKRPLEKEKTKAVTKVEAALRKAEPKKEGADREYFQVRLEILSEISAYHRFSDTYFDVGQWANRFLDLESCIPLVIVIVVSPSSANDQTYSGGS